MCKVFARLICFFPLSPSQSRKEQISCLKPFVFTSTIQNPYYGLKACMVWPLAASQPPPPFLTLSTLSYYSHFFATSQMYQACWREFLLSGAPTLQLFLGLFPSYVNLSSKITYSVTFCHSLPHCVLFLLLHSTLIVL